MGGPSAQRVISGPPCPILGVGKIPQKHCRQPSGSAAAHHSSAAATVRASTATRLKSRQRHTLRRAANTAALSTPPPPRPPNTRGSGGGGDRQRQRHARRSLGAQRQQHAHAMNSERSSSTAISTIAATPMHAVPKIMIIITSIHTSPLGQSAAAVSDGVKNRSAANEKLALIAQLSVRMRRTSPTTQSAVVPIPFFHVAVATPSSLRFRVAR